MKTEDGRKREGDREMEPELVFWCGRYVCTKDAPWAEGMGIACHPDAVQVGESYDFSDDHNDYETYTCPNCGLTFDVTLPN